MLNAAPPLPSIFDTAEGRRLAATERGEAWRHWGPYVSERQWGTVREDYSRDGAAWEYFPHDDARSRAYRWGEDGIGGWSDDPQRWCLALALWNGRDPILKERMFGLSNSEGNHGEDVKELYYYQDGLPTHAYMRMLYKYPQAEFPYARLVAENRARSRLDPEFELIDTGVFDERRYFDVSIEYAKAAPDDTLMRVTATNRGPEAAAIHLVPQFWARNVWSWDVTNPRPRIRQISDQTVETTHPMTEPLQLSADGTPDLLFCENETNHRRLGGLELAGVFKDGINDYVVLGGVGAVNAAPEGSKCAFHYSLTLAAGETATVRLRLTPAAKRGGAFADFDLLLAKRRVEADEFYSSLQQQIADPERRAVQRAALAGMLWSKQYYDFDIPTWLDGDPSQPAPPPERRVGRNASWLHISNSDVIAMPDKWEFPWYASWDLAFHSIAHALIDPEFAKAQLVLLTHEWYMHPNGQLPAYEWALGDVNPPVQAHAAWRIYQIDKSLRGAGDLSFLERIFNKLLLNFTWWVNRNDSGGRNIFQGGFLGLDNIGMFDRSKPLPTGGVISQSDGTAWMAMYTVNLLRIALELGQYDHVYEDIALKFFEHFLFIANAVENVAGGDSGLWDEADEFYYDVLNLPDGTRLPLRARSMVGLIPMFAVAVIDRRLLDRTPGFAREARRFVKRRPDLGGLISRWQEPNRGDQYLLSLLRGHRLKRLLRRALDEAEFLSAYGVRSLSKAHAESPFVFSYSGVEYRVDYEAGESCTELFGGNSNWRGPVWMPVNYLLIDSLYEFHRYYGDDFRVEFPVGTGCMATLAEIADDLRNRLASLFLKSDDGRRPSLGASDLIQNDRQFCDHMLFHEYYHGESGAGLGASHQTGWSGLIALLLQPRDENDACGLPIDGASTFSSRRP